MQNEKSVAPRNIQSSSSETDDAKSARAVLCQLALAEEYRTGYGWLSVDVARVSAVSSYIADVCTRALTSCCAAARPQCLSQNSGFSQQPPRGWMRPAQHAIFVAEHFSPQGGKSCCAFSPEANKSFKKTKHLF